MNIKEGITRIELLQIWQTIQFISLKLDERYPNEELVAKDSCKAFFDVFKDFVGGHNKRVERIKRKHAVSKNGVLARLFNEEGKFIDYEYSVDGLNALEDELEVFMQEVIEMPENLNDLMPISKSQFPKEFVADFGGALHPILNGLILKE